MATVRTTSSEDELTDETVIGPQISIRGRIDGEEDLRVEGRVEGTVSLTETLYVEPEGVVIAQVEARDVVISGILIGDVTASNRVTLNKGAKLVGNMHAPRVIIADGAAFRGDIVMNGEEAPPSRERTRATATVPRGAVGGRGRARAGSYEAPSRRAPATRREVAAPAPAPAASPSSRPAAKRSPSRAAPPPRAAARRPGADEDDVTVVIKHAALRKGEAPPEEEEPTKKRRRAKKSARMPARGRRKAGRRGS
jgi:cytoskeletal protein CcmA (bactofilin family)